MEELIRPDYYKDDNGADLFHQFEHGPMPIDAGIAFCYMNICKYLQRAGKKTRARISRRFGRTFTSTRSWLRSNTKVAASETPT